uniref:Uncharacterized protein n=1 Tax=Romanomermis culicivorax TaxID=13658 RepID=A0A915KC06_ROMCU
MKNLAQHIHKNKDSLSTAPSVKTKLIRDTFKKVKKLIALLVNLDVPKRQGPVFRQPQTISSGEKERERGGQSTSTKV